MSDHLKMPVYDFDSAGNYPKEKMRTAPAFSSETIANAAIRFLDQRDSAKPFLLYAAFTSPHDPRMAPKQFADLYRPEQVTFPRNFLPQHPFDNGELKVRDELLAPFPRTESEVRKHIAAYYAMVTEVDHHIGRIVDALDRAGLAANTYIVFAGGTTDSPSASTVSWANRTSMSTASACRWSSAAPVCRKASAITRSAT